MNKNDFLGICIGLALLVGMVIPTAAGDENTTDTTTTQAARDDRVLKIAWDIPSSDFARYPITEYSYWAPINDPIGGGFRFLQFRDNDNFDESHWGGYFFFRPLVLDFSSTYISIGAYLSFDALTVEGHEPLDATVAPTNPVVTPCASLDSRGIPLSAGLSVMFSFPEPGIQIVMELGHYWNRTRVRYSDVLLPYPLDPTDPNLPPVPGRVRGIQNESGLDMFCGINFMAERSFLAGLSLNVFGTYRSGPVTVTAKSVYPEDVDGWPVGAQEIDGGEPERTSFVLAVAYVKLLAIPIAQQLPFLPFQQYDLITIEPAAGVGHFAADDGHVLGAGCRISFFDLFAFSYFHTWEQQNDGVNADTYVVEVGIQLGRRLGARK